MKYIVYVVAILLVATACTLSAVTVVMRDGKQHVGDVIAKDDTNVVLRTKTATMTIAWRNMTIESFKALNPDLYAQLKAEADERAKLKAEAAKTEDADKAAQGMVKFNGKWITKEEADRKKLERVGMHVESREKSVITSRDNSSSGSYRDKNTYTKNWGEVLVKMDGFNPKDTHTFKIAITHYVVGMNYMSIGSSGTPNAKQTVEKEQSLSGEDAYELTFATEEYQRYKSASFSSYSGGSKYEYGQKSDGFDISMWLNGTLVYEETRKNAPKFIVVGKR